MTNSEIVINLYNSGIVKNIILNKNYNKTGNEDLEEMIYLKLLKMNNFKLNFMNLDDYILKYVTRIVRNQICDNRHEYGKQYKLEDNIQIEDYINYNDIEDKDCRESLEYEEEYQKKLDFIMEQFEKYDASNYFDNKRDKKRQRTYAIFHKYILKSRKLSTITFAKNLGLSRQTLFNYINYAKNELLKDWNNKNTK